MPQTIFMLKNWCYFNIYVLIISLKRLLPTLFWLFQDLKDDMHIENRGHRKRLVAAIEVLPVEELFEEIPVSHYYDDEWYYVKKKGELFEEIPVSHFGMILGRPVRYNDELFVSHRVLLIFIFFS